MIGVELALPEELAEPLEAELAELADPLELEPLPDEADPLELELLPDDAEPLELEPLAAPELPEPPLAAVVFAGAAALDCVADALELGVEAPAEAVELPEPEPFAPAAGVAAVPADWLVVPPVVVPVAVVLNPPLPKPEVWAAAPTA